MSFILESTYQQCYEHTSNQCPSESQGAILGEPQTQEVHSSPQQVQQNSDGNLDFFFS